MKKIHVQNAETHLVVVHTVNDRIEAELIKNELQNYGIEAKLGGARQAGFPGAFPIDIIVCEYDQARATELIQRHTGRHHR